jgi:hypothetical protein
MPFGLKNTGATYQRMMQNCLGSQIGGNIQVYIDDVVITTRKQESLIRDLQETFDNLNRYKLKLNPTKCSFGVSAGQLLGFLVSARGIEANPEKIQATLIMGKPAKLYDMEKLAGRVAALSRFIARLGEKALPFLCTDEKVRQQIRVDRRGRCSVHAAEKSAFHTTSVGRTERKGSTATVYRGHTSSGEHGAGSRAKGRREGTWSTVTSILPQQSPITNKTEVPALSKACI